MKATGIVRRIDDLGRVVIPKEIRRTMRIREGDPLEIYTDNDGEVIFKKYSPIGELSNFAGQYAEVLYKTHGIPVAVCDRDHVVAAAGIPKKEILERRVAPQLEEIIEHRKNYAYTDPDQHKKVFPIEGVERYTTVVSPILASGDVCGCIMFMSGEGGGTAGETEIKLIQTAAAFLGKQMEE
ncbi:MAG: stage V sporulation T C-terminal domain-containing protein [Oscillospiraceae bacterium]